jgi:hypothetical protein
MPVKTIQKGRMPVAKCEQNASCMQKLLTRIIFDWPRRRRRDGVGARRPGEKRKSSAGLDKKNEKSWVGRTLDLVFGKVWVKKGPPKIVLDLEERPSSNACARARCLPASA